MKKIRNIVLFFFMATACDLGAQQDDQLSQYIFNPIAVNPAYAGSKGLAGATLSARKQWLGFDGTPFVFAISAHSPLMNNTMAVGLRVRNEKDFFQNRFEFSLCYAYRISLGRGKLAFGLSAGINQSVFNWNAINFKDQTDKFAVGARSSVVTPRIDAGVFYNSDRFFVSFSATHLADGFTLAKNGTDYSGNLKPHFYLICSKAFQINDDLILNPSINVKYVAAAKPLADIICYAGYKSHYWLGLGYRTNTSFMLIAQFQANERLRIGYSYDFFAFKKVFSSFQTHEIMFSYDMNRTNKKTISIRYF